MLPLGVEVNGMVAFTSEVPISVRWTLEVGEGSGDWLITTDLSDPEAARRISDGEEVIAVPSLADPVLQARETMRVARRRGEWEAAMTHESLLPYLREEVDEFADAVGSADSNELKRELGDILLQVLFHAEIASGFDFGDVAQAFVDKMRSRAPYLFDGSTGIVAREEQDRLWAEGKARESREGS